MTAPGDDGDADPDRESGDERDASSPSDTHEEPFAGSAERDGERTTGQDVAGGDNAPETDAEGGSPGIATRHRQERETRRPPAVGSDEQPRPGTAAEEGSATWTLFARDVVTSVLAVALLGAYLFAISGVWPPMVAIESGSMEPNMEVNDLVFLMETERFQPAEAQAGTGIVTAATGSETGYDTYGRSGDVIVFRPDGEGNTTPIIHRAMFWVEEGENWCEQANRNYLGSLDPEDEDCIAQNAGFITKGDNNDRYDQASVQADRPVKPEWVVGTAEARIPGMGWFRLRFQ